jgi:immune inhibitor A
MRPRVSSIVIFLSLLLLACLAASVVITISMGVGGPKRQLAVDGPPTVQATESGLPIPSQLPTATHTPLSGRNSAPALTPSLVASSTSRPSPTPAGPSSTEQVLANTVIPVRDRLDLARRFKLSDQPIPAVVNPTPPNYQVGDQETFWVGESDTLRHFEVTATLRYKGSHSYWWIEDGYSVADADVAASAEAFDNVIYPTDRAFFGSEWSPGVDNDPRVHIFVGNVPGVGGYFYSINEYSKLINRYSNEKEMFFINIKATHPGSDQLDAVLAHEFQHMIHWYNDANEETWINEGLSELAMVLNGYDTGGTERAFAQMPDTQLDTWGDSPNESIAHYGGSFLFMSYFLERFGEEAMRQVVARPENGADGFNAVLAARGEPYRFDDVFADWLVANYLDDPNLDDGRWGYRDVSIGPLKMNAEQTAYPADSESTVSQYAADYVALKDLTGDVTLAFTGTTQVKVVPNEPHSGMYQWWSNRGDDSDMSMTRSFDLGGVGQAALEFWTWYDIESDWDFAYVEVSTDGGQTWDILPGRYTTNENKSGNSFGHAWTGVSGGGDTPQWVQEQVDLSAYAGQAILVRFEYITDDAVNHAGFLVDDIAIPAIGYLDDAEAGAGGWQADGFVRIDNRLPQRYVVQAIVPGDQPQVQRMTLDADNRGQLTVTGLDQNNSDVVLVISGLTPFTTEVANYRYSVTLTH